MEPKSRRIANTTSGVAAVAAFVTQPIPLLDELIVAPIHYALIFRMASARGFSPLRLPWKNLNRIVWYGAAARFVSHLGLGLIPVLGAFANSLTAIALTEYLSRYLDDVIRNPDQPAPEITMEGLKELFSKALSRAAKDGRVPPAAQASAAPAAAAAAAPSGAAPPPTPAAGAPNATTPPAPAAPANGATQGPP